MHFLASAWSQIWPNLVAGLFPSGAVAASHVKRVNMARRHHAEMKQHIARIAASASARPQDLDPPADGVLK